MTNDKDARVVPQIEKNKVGDYDIVSDLGEGTFGSVKLARHTAKGVFVAIKVLEKNRLKEQKDRDRVDREVKILKEIDHPSFVQLYEIIETADRLYLIMEYASGGELFDFIVSKDRLPER